MRTGIEGHAALLTNANISAEPGPEIGHISKEKPIDAHYLRVARHHSWIVPGHQHCGACDDLKSILAATILSNALRNDVNGLKLATVLLSHDGRAFCLFMLLGHGQS